MAPDIPDEHHASAPFEGPEKLLEIWFAPSAFDLPDSGLRKVNRAIWEDMLDIVKCKVLSVVQGDEIDAYLLSESSLFIFPHRLILKTCGTTLNLLGLPRILEIAATHANLPSVYRCFYSRKAFMFPERQLGPHRDWKQEVEYLDNIFDNGAAYTVGKVNGDHWLLYMTNPDRPSNPFPRCAASTHASGHVVDVHPDFTIEILMSDLSADARLPFFSAEEDVISQSPSTHAQDLSKKLEISEIFPSHLTTLDAYSFSPCGYSSNALIKWGHDSLFSNHDSPENRDASTQPGHFGEGYYTIHVTPEEGWSYASFECNVPLSASPSPSPQTTITMIPDLQTLIRRVVQIFQPGRITLTLFISSIDNEAEDGDSAVEAAQKAFKTALSEPLHTKAGQDRAFAYKRTDKINYEFGGYDLAFASFEVV